MFIENPVLASVLVRPGCLEKRAYHTQIPSLLQPRPRLQSSGPVSTNKRGHEFSWAPPINGLPSVGEGGVPDGLDPKT